MELKLFHGESPVSIILQTSGSDKREQGKVNNEEDILLFDSGAEVSIIDTTFSCKIGCHR